MPLPFPSEAGQIWPISSARQLQFGHLKDWWHVQNTCAGSLDGKTDLHSENVAAEMWFTRRFHDAFISIYRIDWYMYVN